jgi:hypothetical protein
VPALATRDAERLLDFVAEAERIGGDQPFTPELLVGLGELVHADWITYNELDHVRRRSLLEVARLGDEEDDPADPASIFWTIVVEEHPICVRHQQGDFRALKLSDFVTARQLHKLRVYDVWLRPYSVERELNVALPSPLWHTKSFIFDREPAATSRSATASCSIAYSRTSPGCGGRPGRGGSSDQPWRHWIRRTSTTRAVSSSSAPPVRSSSPRLRAIVCCGSTSHRRLPITHRYLSSTGWRRVRAGRWSGASTAAV